MNYYRRYVGDYLRDTARLSMIEHGAYNLLLDYYYADERPLPADKDELYLMVRAMRPDDRKAVDKVLRLFFTQEPDGYHQKRVDHEIAVSKTARGNGKGGGRPKTGEQTGSITGLETGTGTEDITGQKTGAITGEGGGSGHPPTTNHQPPASNLQPPEKKGAKKTRATTLPSDFQVSERVRTWAASKGHESLDRYLEFFTGRMKANGKTYVDWDEAFMNCIREDWPGFAKANGQAYDYTSLIANIKD